MEICSGSGYLLADAQIIGTEPTRDRQIFMDLQKPLSDTELEQLKDFLTPWTAKGAMGLEELDGFLTAVMCSPNLIQPSKFLPVIWGTAAQDLKFQTTQDASDVHALIFRHWNAIGTVVQNGKTYTPLVDEIAEGVPDGSKWARGFLRGMRLDPAPWAELNKNEQNSGCLVPILILGHEHDPDPQLRTPPISAEIRNEIIARVAEGVSKAYTYFEGHRLAMVRELKQKDVVHRVAKKVGRNDPCPCGSGKKFKRCCDNGAMNHIN